MNQREIDVLEKCLEQIQAGVSIDECIKKFPELTSDMIEVLRTTRNLMSLGENKASDELMKRSLIKLLSQATRLKAENTQAAPRHMPNSLGERIREYLRGGASLRPLMSRMALVVGITALLILVSGGLVITSAKSLPGDSLYPVKIAVEDITVYLVPGSEIKQQYEHNYSQQRLDEVNRLIALNRTQQISFEGVLAEMTSSSWIVSGIPITIQSNTAFVGELKGTASFVIGSVVEVEGITNAQGGVSANEIHLRQYQFTGIVEKIDKNIWQISGTKLSITPRSQIQQGIIVGDEVNVIIRSEDNGLYAISIQSAPTPATVQSMESTENSNQSEVENPSEHRVIDTHEVIATPEAEHTLVGEVPSHEESRVTAEPPVDSEHEGSAIVVPTENHVPDSHEEGVSATPVQHETPEPSENH